MDSSQMALSGRLGKEFLPASLQLVLWIGGLMWFESGFEPLVGVYSVNVKMDTTDSAPSQ